MPQTKEWTLMFYFASDNPLAPGIVSQLKAIKDAGFHPDANVIARFDPHVVGAPSQVFEVNLINKLKSPGRSSIGFEPDNSYVRNLAADKLWDKNHVDLRERIKKELRKEGGNGDGRAEGEGAIEYDPPIPGAEMSGEQAPRESLAAFLDFCRGNYPARHYMLFILGHGMAVGSDLFLLDEHSPLPTLPLTELGEVLRKFRDDICEDAEPSQLELLGFHSCSMSALEVAYELKGTANYMLASQGPAFVGSWPYRQILMRIFSDLNNDADFTADDLKDAHGLAVRLREGDDKVSAFLRGRLDPGTVKLLKNLNGNGRPDAALSDALVRELNRMLDDTTLRRAGALRNVRSEARARLGARKPSGVELRRLNRTLLADACPHEVTRVNVKAMVTKIFYYCIYNSVDFQLAGYSFDLCLCDMKKVHEVEGPLTELSRALVRGLKQAPVSGLYGKKRGDPLMKDLILLAHWDAQSYWQENYTDLYDFCFRLAHRCREARPASKPMRAIRDDVVAACKKVMDKLRRGYEGADNGVIVRSAFAGPSYQYSHGLSLFFPWARPFGSQLWDEEYPQYKLSKKTPWREFLEEYFEVTRRQPHSEEMDEREPRRNGHADLTRTLLDIGTLVFNESGQLGGFGKGGGGDVTGLDKGGGGDVTGGDYPVIKNYPRFTRECGKMPVSPNFFEKFS